VTSQEPLFGLTDSFPEHQLGHYFQFEHSSIFHSFFESFLRYSGQWKVRKLLKIQMFVDGTPSAKAKLTELILLSVV